MATERRTQQIDDTAVCNYMHPATAWKCQGTCPVRDTRVYAQPAPLTRSSPNYQELNAVRENEDIPYQGLRLTTRMKRPAELINQR